MFELEEAQDKRMQGTQLPIFPKLGENDLFMHAHIHLLIRRTFTNISSMHVSRFQGDRAER